MDNNTGDYEYGRFWGSCLILWFLGGKIPISSIFLGFASPNYDDSNPNLWHLCLKMEKLGMCLCWPYYIGCWNNLFLSINVYCILGLKDIFLNYEEGMDNDTGDYKPVSLRGGSRFLYLVGDNSFACLLFRVDIANNSASFSYCRYLHSQVEKLGMWFFRPSYVGRFNNSFPDSNICYIFHVKIWILDSLCAYPCKRKYNALIG